MEQELADRSKGQAELTKGMALVFTDAACIMPGGRAGIRRKFKDPPAENDDEKNSALRLMPKRCYFENRINASLYRNRGGGSPEPAGIRKRHKKEAKETLTEPVILLWGPVHDIL